MAKRQHTGPQLVDYLGRPVRKARLEDELAAPTITGVRSVLSGHPAQGLTPERLTRLLREAEQGDMTRYLELAEEMEEKDAHYRSVLGTRKLQVSGLELVVESATDKAEDVADADFVRDFLLTGVLQQALYDILDAIGKGFSCCEIMWECAENVWLPGRISWRDPRWFTFDDVDGVTPLLIGDNGERLPLEPCKFIFHVPKSKSGLPCRGGLARAAAWGYLFKNFDLKAWMIFAEVYGHPIRLGKYDPSATEEDKLTLLRAVRDVGMDHAAIIPDSMLVEFVEAKGLGTVTLYEKLAEYLDRQTSKLVLGQTGTTDTGTRVGTANAHEHVRDDIERSDAAQLAATLNRDLIRPLVLFNRGERSRYPELILKRPIQEDVGALVDNVVKLAPIGFTMETSVMRDKIGVPDPEEGAELLMAPRAPEEKREQGKGEADAADKDKRNDEEKKKKAAASSESLAAPVSPDPIEELADDLTGDWQPLLSPLTDPILALAEACADENEFLQLLPGLASKQDAQDLTERLARAVFAAKLAGVAGVEE